MVNYNRLRSNDNATQYNAVHAYNRKGICQVKVNNRCCVVNKPSDTVCCTIVHHHTRINFSSAFYLCYYHFHSHHPPIRLLHLSYSTSVLTHTHNLFIMNDNKITTGIYHYGQLMHQVQQKTYFHQY